MKTIKEIQVITQKATQEKKRKSIERLEKERKKELQRLKDEDKHAKDSISFFIEEIELAAKQGKHFYGIDLGTISDGNTIPRRLRLEKQYIKKELKSFNPTFTLVPRIGCVTNYDDEIIDHNHYTALHVLFSW